MNYILDDAGNPVAEPDVIKWAMWFQQAERSIVRDDLPGDVTVSTVFLGLDHSYTSDGPPVLFETMVFGGPLDQEQERYTSRAAAIEGHATMLARVREA